MSVTDRLMSLPAWTVAPRLVGMARAGVGAAAIIEAVEVAPQLRALSGGRTLALPRWEALPVLTAGAVPLFLAAWLFVAAAFCLGWRTRVMGIALTGVLTYVLAADRQLYTNHLYLMTLLVLLFTLARSGAAFSIDARRGRGSPAIPAWPVLLVRAQVSIVYLFAAAAKFNVVYVSGVVLRAGVEAPAIQSLPPVVFTGAAIASLATELFLGVALWRPKLRTLAFLAGTVFHLTILATMQLLPDLLTFALLMLSGYLCFLAPMDGRRRVAAGPEHIPGEEALVSA
ncbi:MAG TPA: HTTM domain-containing protein [Actinomycetota bacterium]|nr:HTTM domain-containing protein [Actinomycetota bacterium]